jgi:hypothetical protein
MATASAGKISKAAHGARRATGGGPGKAPGKATGRTAHKRPSARAARLAALIAELENAVEAVGIRVRRERLMREVGYHARSGLCRVEGEPILFIDHDLSPDDEIELLALTLSGKDLADVDISPEARRLLARAPQEAVVDKEQPRP